MSRGVEPPVLGYAEVSEPVTLTLCIDLHLLIEGFRLGFDVGCPGRFYVYELLEFKIVTLEEVLLRFLPEVPAGYGVVKFKELPLPSPVVLFQVFLREVRCRYPFTIKAYEASSAISPQFRRGM